MLTLVVQPVDPESRKQRHCTGALVRCTHALTSIQKGTHTHGECSINIDPRGYD